MGVTITTNNVPRPVVDAWELPADVREDFDYLDWAAIERGEESATFVQYRGEWYDLHDFESTRARGIPDELKRWDGYSSDSFFSGVVIRYADESCETVILGTYYS